MVEKTGNNPSEPPEDAMPKRDVELRRFSPRRKSTLIVISMLMTIALIIAGAATTASQYGKVGRKIEASGTATESSRSLIQDNLRDSRNLSLALTVGSLIPVMLVVAILLRAGPRIVELELWIQRMGAGDLAHTVRPRGNDEITEITHNLEALRRHSVRSQKMDLVQQLSKDLQGKNEELEDILQQLHRTQNQVISRQKLVELGELTAGVAHEIRNPLNFIQNFSQTSEKLMEELKETLDGAGGAISDDQQGLIDEIAVDLKENMTRMREHSDRANRIVQGMLAMGRNTSGDFRETNINQLVRDNIALAYQAARASDTDFNLEIVEGLDPDAGLINAVPEDLGRVFLNIVSNACYAINEKARQTPNDPHYQPTLWVSTKRAVNAIEINIRDNGNGIPPEVIDHIFNPFFTTKPPNWGTGLGLSICNDIVRQHGGSITPESKPGQYTAMLVSIPTTTTDQAEAQPRDNQESTVPA